MKPIVVELARVVSGVIAAPSIAQQAQAQPSEPGLTGSPAETSALTLAGLTA